MANGFDMIDADILEEIKDPAKRDKLFLTYLVQINSHFQNCKEIMEPRLVALEKSKMKNTIIGYSVSGITGLVGGVIAVLTKPLFTGGGG